jgi:hypothetical protein
MRLHGPVAEQRRRAPGDAGLASRSTDLLSLGSFVVLGGALAGVFPAMVLLTPIRIGSQRAQHVIAWQVGAAAAGGAGISALVGLLIGQTTLAILGPSLTVLAVLLIGTELILTRLAPI